MGTRQNRVKIHVCQRERANIRKLAECVLYGKSVAYCLEGGKNAKRDTNENGPTRVEPATIIVRNQGQTYADLLKGARKVLAGEDKATLKASFRTKEGNLRLVIDQTQERAAKLTEKLQAELGEGAKCNIREQRVAYYIHEIDEITTKEEVQAASVVRFYGVGRVPLRGLEGHRG
ncbi:hypothetical protein RI129_000164 [Pyrocoelia pectoralis]|uniref:Uncharacterized protein n=1 Tax=Pyrocoelia pectoralis TaxID=417401 RepID=A0AAN7US89_9COLE